MKFLNEVLILPDGTKKDNGWWEIGDDGFLYNRFGGRHKYEPKEGDLIVEKDDWGDIIKETVRDDSKETGWIGPDGQFYGCSRQDHKAMAEFYFGLNELQLEAMGYVKVYELPFYMLSEMAARGEDVHRLAAYVTEKSTIAQEDKLENLGFAPRREGSNIWVK